VITGIKINYIKTWLYEFIFNIFTRKSSTHSKNINQTLTKYNFDMAKKTVITEVQDVEVGESILEFPQNRTLMVEQLTFEEPAKPEIVNGLKTVDDVFEHYKPKVDVEFQDMEGVPKKESLHFSNLGDFGVKGITAQSAFLQGLQIQQDEYQKIIKQLKSNKQLRTVIEDVESKQAMLGAIHALLKELEDAK